MAELNDYQKRLLASLLKCNGTLPLVIRTNKHSLLHWYDCITETREEAVKLNEQLRPKWHDAAPDINALVDNSQEFARQMYAERRERKARERLKLLKARNERQRDKRRRLAARKLQLLKQINQKLNNNTNESEI